MKLKLALGVLVLSFQGVFAGHFKFVNASNGKHKLDSAWIDIAKGDCNNIRLSGTHLEETNGCDLRNHFTLAIDGQGVHEFKLKGVSVAENVTVQLEENRVVVTYRGYWWKGSGPGATKQPYHNTAFYNLDGTTR